MDNLGDWIYIILIAVVGISSIFSSTRKKKGENKPVQIPPQDVEVENEPETMLDKDFWDTFWDTPANPKTTVKKPVAKQQETIKKMPPSVYSKESEIEQIIRNQKPSIIQVEEEGAPPLIAAEELHDTESLRKAVIYAEILERKY